MKNHRDYILKDKTNHQLVSSAHQNTQNIPE